MMRGAVVWAAMIEFVNFRSSNSNDLNHSSDADLRS